MKFYIILSPAYFTAIQFRPIAHDALVQMILALGLYLYVEYHTLGRLGPQVEPDFLAVVMIWRKLTWEKINGDGSLAGSGGTLLGYCSLSSGK